MKVLMFSMDRSLVGEKTSTGDTVLRHKVYGGYCDELNIVVFSKKGYLKQELAENVFCWPTNSRSRFCYFKDAIKIGKKIYNDKGYDLVIGDIFTGWPAFRISKKFGVKFLMHMHGDFWNNKDGLEGRFSNRILMMMSKYLAKKADASRVVSKGIAVKLVKSGIDKKKIYVIPTPFDLQKFLTFNQARVNELKEQYSGRNLLFVGRLEMVKNLEWFLDVFAEIKKGFSDLSLLIVGEGSLKESLKDRAKNLGIEKSVKFVGRVDYEDLVHYYQISNIFVQPSLSESFGKVMIEAGAAGLPVVASATTGAKEIIEDGETGFVVPIRNIKKMIEKIELLLNDEKLASEMGQKAKEYVQENFDGDMNTEKIIKLWQSLVFENK